MTRLRSIATIFLAVGCCACGAVLPRLTSRPAPNVGRQVIATELVIDIHAMTASARITFDASVTAGAVLEVGDLAIEQITAAGSPLAFSRNDTRLTLALPASSTPSTVEIAYRWRTHEWGDAGGFTGAMSGGYTNTWPYYCGNVFPCHSDPADGTTFALDLTGVAPGKTAIYPSTIPFAAPAYQLAWSVDTYTELSVGTTTAGTRISAWYRPHERERMQQGTKYLTAAFDWLERTLGPYAFGDHVGSVAVDWPNETYGGIEHHPYWHVAGSALDNPLVHVHEAAHGWFGDAIRLGCWEDFVLSEGTASYLAARALSVVAPDAGAQAWQDYAEQLAHLDAQLPVWPPTCGRVDVLRDHLFTAAPYVRGAFFFKAVADAVGTEVLDHALARFYRERAGTAAHMRDLLATIAAVTGYDPTADADIWLRGRTLPVPGDRLLMWRHDSTVQAPRSDERLVDPVA